MTDLAHIIYHGTIHCGLELLVAGRSTIVRDGVEVHEDIYGALYLTANLEWSDDRLPRPGDEVELRIACSELGNPRSIRLWCLGTSVYRNHHMQCVIIEAGDIFAMTQHTTVFAAYPGQCTLDMAVRTIIEALISSPINQVTFTGAAPLLVSEWLVQCQETGADFIRRLAASCGIILFYDGRDIVLGNMKQGVPEISPTTKLDYDTNLVSHTTTTWPGSHRLAATWLDFGSLDRQTITVAGSPPTCSGPKVYRRHAAISCLPQASLEAYNPEISLGTTISAHTVQPDLRPGSKISTADGVVYIIEKITHSLSSQGAYRNTVWGTVPEYWGLKRSPEHGFLKGPFLARVVENNDPGRQGRLRVKLVEDQNAQLSPWLPFVVPAAGKNRGWYWLPEVDDQVWAVSDGDHPERMWIIGAARGALATVPASWQSADNMCKVFKWRNGSEFRCDEKTGTIILQSGESAITLDAEGTIAQDCKNIALAAKEKINANAGNTVNIDGKQIFLG